MRAAGKRPAEWNPKEPARTTRRLRHGRQSEIVAIAALVAGLESVATDGKGRAAGEINECANDRVRRDVVDDGKDSAEWECTCLRIFRAVSYTHLRAHE